MSEASEILVIAREYPGDYEPISLAETRRAVKIARRVRNEMRRLLPKEILRK